MKNRYAHPVLMCLCIVGGLCAAFVASRLETKLDHYRMTVLDVGQGQCVLLQAEDENYVVDCGSSYSKGAVDLAARTLLSQGVTEIDGLILSHYDVDHAGGAEAFLSRIPAAHIYLPDVEDDGGIRSLLQSEYAENIIWIPQGESLSIPEGELTIFGGMPGKTDNESSLCVLFQPENCDILITSDRSTVGEEYLLTQTDLPELEVLVVGHHGAADSTGLFLLRETMPKLAVISVGVNQYGHPSEEVLELLALFGCQVLRTDLNGTITVRG